MAVPDVHAGGSAITTLLLDWRRGDASAVHRLMPLVHHELRRLARRQLRQERPGHTLETGALVNEAYLRLADLRRLTWQDRAHFFAMASRIMRRILVDYARARRADKRGGTLQPEPLAAGMDVGAERAVTLVALDDALTGLGRVHRRAARVVELRFFGGLTVEETADSLGVSAETVARDWRLARAWLHRAMQGR